MVNCPSVAHAGWWWCLSREHTLPREDPLLLTTISVQVALFQVTLDPTSPTTCSLQPRVPDPDSQGHCSSPSPDTHPDPSSAAPPPHLLPSPPHRNWLLYVNSVRGQSQALLQVPPQGQALHPIWPESFSQVWYEQSAVSVNTGFEQSKNTRREETKGEGNQHKRKQKQETSAY